MKQIIEAYTVYDFDELSQEARDKAINDYIQFLLDTDAPELDEGGVYYDSAQEAERLHTPWFLASIIWENHSQDIISDIKANEYTYLADGTMKNEQIPA